MSASLIGGSGQESMLIVDLKEAQHQGLAQPLGAFCPKWCGLYPRKTIQSKAHGFTLSWCFRVSFA